MYVDVSQKQNENVPFENRNINILIAAKLIFYNLIEISDLYFFFHFKLFKFFSLINLYDNVTTRYHFIYIFRY